MRVVASYLLWPLLMGGAIAGYALFRDIGHPVVAFNVCYFALVAAILILERIFPHEREWLPYDGEIGADLGHTILGKASVQLLIVVLAVIGLVDAFDPAGAAWWPSDAPEAVQVILALVIAEFGFYWAHRLAHEWPLLWRFHAIHHSVRRLWVVNTGRFHFVDTMVSVLFGLTLAFVVGVPKDMIIWVSILTAFFGLLTHCNIEMRFGPLSYVFNTPGLHRWHHSMVLEEGNRNYGENLILFDQIFGTFINPDRRPPATIGVHEPMPRHFLAQLVHPFRRRENAPSQPPSGASPSR